MMLITHFEKYECGIYVPNYIINNLGHRRNHERKFDERPDIINIEFELEQNQWCLFDDGEIIRYRLDEENDVRKHFVDQCISKANSSKPYDAPKYLLSAARLLHINLSDLLKQIKSTGSKSYTESYKEIFKSR